MTLVLLQPVHTNGKYANCVIYNVWVGHVPFICTVCVSIYLSVHSGLPICRQEPVRGDKSRQEATRADKKRQEPTIYWHTTYYIFFSFFFHLFQFLTPHLPARTLVQLRIRQSLWKCFIPKATVRWDPLISEMEIFFCSTLRNGGRRLSFLSMSLSLWKWSHKMSHFQLPIGSNATPKNRPACAFALSAQRLCCTLSIPSEFLLVIRLMNFIN